MDQFKNIGLVGRLNSSSVVVSLKLIIPFLQERGLNVIVDRAIGELVSEYGLQESALRLMGESCDMVIVVGGDGTLLGAARELAPYKVPVLGVNRGNLGFLTDITPDQVCEKITEVLEGRYTIENRFLIDAFVRRKGLPVGEGSALNEVILHPGKTARLIRFDLYIEGEYVYNQRSDGLIVATPTGSTAYSLSGGGPIMHPRLDAIVLVPMFPHTLSSRPIVVDGNVELKIVVDERNETFPNVSCDGQTNIVCAPGDVITIRKKPQKLRLIHPLSYNFYETCRSKLGWGAKLGE
ncbi:NAD(+) kinase [Motiliproteus sp. MSK22-1]|uniref:NAD(+) kinase n=1 Tax=Motiliproteus sp. MSK22-1 TaxID=1897630 RepID=UPI000978B44A|nr:NAD(+) kinase [Motiliproteus sp. MSK22-1]OMH25304.1 NAD kinase [Motiliproteus sp. MSK22-1]